MLIAAPDSGGTSRNPSCVKTSASPKQNAEPNARTTATLINCPGAFEAKAWAGVIQWPPVRVKKMRQTRNEAKAHAS